MKKIIEEIEVNKINNSEAVYEWLKQFTYHEKTRFFIIED